MNRHPAVSARHARGGQLPQTSPYEPVPEEEAKAWAARLARMTRACCCPARPSVVAIMPPGPGRPGPVDLLLCQHHYRKAEAELKAAGAVVYGAERWWAPRHRHDPPARVDA